ncbi:MAG: pyrimidine 5'-nucleotidase [Rhodospirillaceae bacterium]|nr:pyrimidine 5'-nucleotidase [Rhodospirillaceae bacterium]
MPDKPEPVGRVEAWIFDLDNTLYPASASLFPQIDRRMSAFIAGALNLSLDDALTLQKQYYWKYGTTLRGLMLNHDIEPDAFLEYVHDIDHSVLSPDTRLDAALARLPGRKFIHTNGSERHAVMVADRLGVSRHFSGIFDIRASNYMPKPEPEPYAALVARHGITPGQAVMFEDIHRNLKPAADLGMTTVWVRHAENAAKPNEDTSHCRFITHDLIDWMENVDPANRNS